MDYERVATAIHFVEQHAAAQPSLDDVAAHVGLSPFHLQRVFKRWAGVSPKRFLQFLTVEHAKQRLRESRSVLDAAYDVGLSGPGRLHDLLVSVESVTPGEFKRQGEGLVVRHGTHATPFGECTLAMTDRGICALSFGGDALDDWARADLREDHDATARVVESVFAGSGSPLHLRGTNFQIKVWQALLQIPEGAVVSYGDLARRLEVPAGARAVAGAVARNPIAYLIPCHRVLRQSGAIAGFRWGVTRKRAMLAREQNGVSRSATSL